MASLSSLTVPDGTTYDLRALGIPYGHVDSTSTSTAFTAQIPGITNYHDGLIVLLKNGVVTSAANFTININGLGAKGVYSNMAATTRETTIFNINYTLLLIYDSTRVSGGCWINYRGYNSDTNTIGYQLRGNSGKLPMKSITYKYRLLFTSADGKGYVPANNSNSTNATALRAVCQTPIDPFGRIVYYSNTVAINTGATPSAAYLWQQYAFTLGYSFNRTGAALTLDDYAPVYVKCAPQADGSAIMDATTPIVQTLPSTEDGKIYIFLGITYSETNIELYPEHPVYYYKDGAIRLWTNAAASGSADEALTDAEIEDAVDAAFVESGYTVTVSLTNPVSASDFRSCNIYELIDNHVDAAGSYDNLQLLDTIDSADGNVTVSIPSTSFGIRVWPDGNCGASPPQGGISVTGGVEFVKIDSTGGTIFKVTDDGTAVLDGIDYGD